MHCGKARKEGCACIVRGGVVQENADASLDRDERDRQRERPKAVASVMNALNVNDVWVT